MLANPDEEQQLAGRLEWAVQIAHEAGKITLEHFRSPQLEVERKGDDSPVTIADKRAEKLLRERIIERFPGDGICGEEFGESPGDSGFTWTLDPIDGTKSFIHGMPIYTTLVAVLATPGGDLQTGQPKIGVVRAPALNEVVYAQVGCGARYQAGEQEPVPANASTTSKLSEALLVSSGVASFRKYRTPDATDVYLELLRKVKTARTWGDGYGYLQVATGRADVMIDPVMNLWDNAALLPVITEAGGVFCDWQGEPTIHSGEAVAANKPLIDQVLAVTKGW